MIKIDFEESLIFFARDMEKKLKINAKIKMMADMYVKRYPGLDNGIRI